MKISLIDLKRKLSARDIELREPACEESMRVFEDEMSLKISDKLRNLYYSFDGFKSLDYRSQILLWGLDEIMKWNSESNLRDGSVIVIGDFMIHSDFLVTDFHKDVSPIFLLNEKRELATDIEDLLIKLSSGQFDFLE